jgi:hypothetical protein
VLIKQNIGVEIYKNLDINTNTDFKKLIREIWVAKYINKNLDGSFKDLSISSNKSSSSKEEQ